MTLLGQVHVVNGVEFCAQVLGIHVTKQSSLALEKLPQLAIANRYSSWIMVIFGVLFIGLICSLSFYCFSFHSPPTFTRSYFWVIC